MQKKWHQVEFRGRSFGKTATIEAEIMNNFEAKWHLSTEGYYFKYRPDKNNPQLRRATLYKTLDNSIVADVAVNAGYGQKERSHHDLINYFEVTVMNMGQPSTK